MIKVTLGDEVKKTDKSFPRLMMHSDGTIVLFSDNEHGVCLFGCNGTKAGHNPKDGWGMELFTDYNGPVTLQNE